MLSNVALRSVLIATLLVTSSNVMSREITYDYIQGTYISTSVDSGATSGDIDGDGFGVSGSISIAPNIALTAGFGVISFDTFQGVDVDTTELTFGITAYAPVAPGTDIAGNISVLKAEVEATDGFTTTDDDDTGNVISVELRHMATNVLELNIGFSRTDVFDESDNSYGLGARFYANERISLGIGYSFGDDVDSLLLNARFDI